MFHAKSGIFLICNIASVPDTNVAYSYLQHSYFNLMLYCKQADGYKVGLLSIHMIQDKTIQQTISHSFTHNS
jgi:hypothetical protein